MNAEQRRRITQRNNRRRENLRRLYILSVAAAAILLVIFIALYHREGQKEAQNPETRTVSAGTQTEAVSANSTSEGRGELILTPEPTPEATPTPEPVTFLYTVNPEKEDGTGSAGRGRRSDEPASAEEGLSGSGRRRRYYYADGTYLVNGWVRNGEHAYHFSKDGYLAVGWTAIAGEGLYFDERGAWKPDEDGTKLVALTFDDGPGPYTNQILDILARYDAKATFFLLGTEIEKYGSNVLPRMVAEGHLIGNHTYSHVQLPADENADEAEWQFYLCDELIKNYTGGEIARVVRFPFGDYTHYSVQRVNRPNILWDLDTYDWDDGSLESIMGEVTSLLEPGNIFLLHDIYDTTAAACETLIPYLAEQGYKMVTVEELAASRGYELENGVTYLSFKQMNIDEGRVTDE